VEVGTAPWRKSTHSGGSGGACVEVGIAPWRKSTYSGAQGGECVEAGTARGVILVRDTKDHGTGPVLRITPADWNRLTASIRL
jgi:hypothetical protein